VTQKKPRKKTQRQYVEPEAANPADNSTTSAPTIPANPTTRESVTRFLGNSNDVPCVRVPPNLEAYASKSLDELRATAMEKSKKVMTREDEIYFFQYYELQKIELTLAAINRRVLMGMIESLM
jgi:hypothetical protein